MKAIILSKQDYEFNDDKTGEIISGSNVYYLIGNGVEPIKLSINGFAKNKHLSSAIGEVPGFYEFDLVTVVKKQKLVQEIGSINFIKKVDLFKDI